MVSYIDSTSYIYDVNLKIKGYRQSQASNVLMSLTFNLYYHIISYQFGNYRLFFGLCPIFMS